MCSKVRRGCKTYNGETYPWETQVQHLKCLLLMKVKKQTILSQENDLNSTIKRVLFND